MKFWLKWILFCMNVCSLTIISFGQDTMHLKEVIIGIEKSKPKPLKSISTDSITLALSKNYTLAELLNRESTVFIKNYGSGALALPVFRGSAAGHTKIFWNGLPLTSPMLGVADLALFPVFALDAVEMQFGAAGLQSGTGGFGGIIDLKSKTVSSNNIFDVFAKQNFGSFGLRQTQLSTSYGNKTRGSTRLYRNYSDNNFKYRNLAKHNFPEEQQEFAEYTQYGLMQTFDIFLNGNSTLSAAFWHQDTKRELPRLMTTANQFEMQKDKTTRFSLSYNNLNDSNLTHSINAGYSYELLQYDNSLNDIHSASIFNRAYIYPEIQYNKIKKLTATAGTQLFFETSTSPKYTKQQYRLNVPFEFDFQPNSKLNLIAILRPEMVDFKMPKLSATAGIAYMALPKNALQLYANGGKNYNFPTLNDLYWWPGGNPDLKPENAILTEAGIKNELQFGNKFLLKHSAGFFSNWINDYIQWLPTGAGFWKPENLKNVWSRGIEASVNWQYKYKSHFLQWNSGYSYVKSTNETAINKFDKTVGKQLIYVPQHQAQSSLTYNYRQAIFSVQYIYTHYRYTPTHYLPAYGLLHASAGANIVSGNIILMFMLKCNNILNTEYQSVEWRPMPGRWFEASVAINFKKPRQ